MEINSDGDPLLLGLKEFQEHLGGQLTIMLLKKIGVGLEVHELDHKLLMKASVQLREFTDTQTFN
jgi:3-dehydroquinate synthase